MAGAGRPLPGLFLNGVVELVADFSKQVLGDADRLQRLGAAGVALTLAVPSRYGGCVCRIPASAIASGLLRLDPLPQGSMPYTGTVDVVVVACLAFSASTRRLYTFELERTASTLLKMREGFDGGWSLPADVPVVAVASDQQQVLGWPESAKGYVEADAVFTQTRTLALGR